MIARRLGQLFHGLGKGGVMIYPSELRKIEDEAALVQDLQERRRTGQSPDVSGGMAQLIEPDETRNIIVTKSFAVEFCRAHRGWSWAEL